MLNATIASSIVTTTSATWLNGSTKTVIRDNATDIHNPESGPAAPPLRGMGELFIFSASASVGTMGSILLISSLVIIGGYQKKGNLFLGSLAFGHLINTLFVLPLSAIAVMAELKGNEKRFICHLQWSSSVIALTVVLTNWMLVAVENFIGTHVIGSRVNPHDWCCGRTKIALAISVSWVVSFALGFLQFRRHLFSSICAEKQLYWVPVPYEVMGSVGVLALLTLLTWWYFLRAFLRTRKFMAYQKQYQALVPSWKRDKITTDQSLLKSNVITYFFSLSMCAPLFVGLSWNHLRGETGDKVPQETLRSFYWLTVAHSCLYSFLYVLSNGKFADSYIKLLLYCCCKADLGIGAGGGGGGGGDGGGDGGGGGGSSKTHINPMLNLYAKRSGGGGGGGGGGGVSAL